MPERSDPKRSEPGRRPRRNYDRSKDRSNDRGRGRRPDPTPRAARASGPEVPPGVTAGDLDPDVRRELVSLPKELAETVGRHLAAAAALIEDDPGQALAHARFARGKAARIAAVREAAGIAAYRAGEWSEALSDLRAARRISGGPGQLPVLADLERALGRPERALELARSPEAKQLGEADRIELLIVGAGARRDLGELDAAVVALQVPELDQGRQEPWSARLFYAYADNLLATGRRDEAIRWFLAAADADSDEQTDAAERLGELTAEPAVP